MALVNLANRLQSDRVGTGLVRKPSGMSPASPMGAPMRSPISAGGGLAGMLKRVSSIAGGAKGGGIGGILRRKLGGQPMMKRPEIRPVSPMGGGVQAPTLMLPPGMSAMQPPAIPQPDMQQPTVPSPVDAQTSLQVPGAPMLGAGGDLRSRLMQLVRRGPGVAPAAY